MLDRATGRVVDRLSLPTAPEQIGWHSGLLRIRTAATYSFMATADDCLELSIDGKRLLNVTWSSDSETGKHCAIKLEAGDHETLLHMNHAEFARLTSAARHGRFSVQP